MSKQGPPKHQNKYAWKPNAGHKINETEPGGRFRPLAEIGGVCQRCKDQIEWKRKYGKYKPLTEAVKCQKCTKRAVRQAYHSLCTGCAKDQGVCPKCCCHANKLVGRDPAEVEAEKKELEEVLRNCRERDKRRLLRAMNKEKPKGQPDKTSDKTSTLQEGQVEGLFSAISLDDYAEASRNNEDGGDDLKICN